MKGNEHKAPVQPRPLHHPDFDKAQMLVKQNADKEWHKVQIELMVQRDAKLLTLKLLDDYLIRFPHVRVTISEEGEPIFKREQDRVHYLLSTAWRQ